jgi:YcaO-like protein with predicted kinase domain
VAASAADAALKTWRRGTHRTVPPAETVARVRPLAAEMGITRVANVTGLDRIGLPVVMVCRPNARSVTVAQGKGVDLDAARASGLMEAAEAHHAETIEAPLKLASARELRRRHRLIDIERLPRSLEGAFDEGLQTLWIEGRELIGGELLWLPLELVGADFTLPLPPGSGCFPATTNGLASGNHLLEAIAHGLFEVVERDATTLWRLGGAAARGATRLDLESVLDPLCCEVLERFARAEVEVAVWETTSDVGLAAFVCLIVGRRDESADPELGAGCHPVREVALLRALTEAAQARMTYITGARDDFAPQLYQPETRRSRLRESRAWLAGEAASRDFAAVPSAEHEDVGRDVSFALARLQAVGIEEVVAVDLTKPELGLPVARVVIPGLEAPYQGAHSDWVPGPRARARLEAGG